LIANLANTAETQQEIIHVPKLMTKFSFAESQHGNILSVEILADRHNVQSVKLVDEENEAIVKKRFYSCQKSDHKTTQINDLLICVFYVLLFGYTSHVNSFAFS